MSLRRLTAFIVCVEICALGVMLSAILAVAAGNGGQITLDFTRYGELWPEYAALVGLTAALPYALYVLDPGTD